MKINFRLECPHCNWGHEWRQDYINQGWISLECPHCAEVFYTKIAINDVKIETQTEEPDAPISGAFRKKA